MMWASSWVKTGTVLLLTSFVLLLGMLAMPSQAFAHRLSSQPVTASSKQQVPAIKQSGASGQVVLDAKVEPLSPDMCNALVIIQKPHGFHATIKSYIAIHFLTKFGISIVGPFSLDWNSLSDLQIGLKVCGMISPEKFFLQIVNTWAVSSSNSFTIGWG